MVKAAAFLPTGGISPKALPTPAGFITRRPLTAQTSNSFPPSIWLICLASCAVLVMGITNLALPIFPPNPPGTANAKKSER